MNGRLTQTAMCCIWVLLFSLECGTAWCEAK